MPLAFHRSVGRYLKNLLIFRSPSTARAVHLVNARFSTSHARDLSRGIYVPEADAYIPTLESEALAILNDLNAVRLLRDKLNATFRYDDRRWTVKIADQSLFARTASDFWLLVEIFVHEGYNFHLPQPPGIVIDVGMNIGAASLYFAKRFSCPIHAFELFPPTFGLAEENFALNPQYENKITRHCVGIGSREENLELSYNDQEKGGVGLYYKPRSINEKIVQVKVLRASDILRPLIHTHEGPVALKLDCEGSEFPVLRDLLESGLLKHIDVILMEWHLIGGNPQDLIEILITSGFAIRPHKSDSAEMGLFYAFRIST